MVVLQAPSPTADDREGANSFSPSPSLLLLLSSLGAWVARSVELAASSGDGVGIEGSRGLTRLRARVWAPGR
jgi:hypothetical protein